MWVLLLVKEEEACKMVEEVMNTAVVQGLSRIASSGARQDWSWGRRLQKVWSYILTSENCSKNGFFAWRLGLEEKPTRRTDVERLRKELRRIAQEQNRTVSEVKWGLIWEYLTKKVEEGDERAKELVVELLKLWHEYMRYRSKRGLQKGQKLFTT